MARPGPVAAAALAAALATHLAFAPSARAQAAEPASVHFRPAVRADVIVARYTSLHGGVSVGVPLGAYVRAEATAAAGPVLRGGGSDFTARTDLVARFLLDPFDQFAYSPYASAGASVRFDNGTVGQLVVLLGVEGSRRGAFRPAVELGLGGGVRLGLTLRQTR